jgi:heavy metal translocating P-type ATPase
MRVIPRREWLQKYGWLSFITICLVICLVLYLVGFVAQAELLVIAVCLLGSVPEAIGIAKDIWQRQFGVDIIALVAVLASLVLKEYAAAGVILLMFTGGKALEEYAKARAQKELSDLLRRKPKRAHVRRGKEFIDISVTKVRPGDYLLIKPGETVPVDAIITQDASSFDESAITGESLPQTKIVGQNILSGSINQDAVVVAKALHTSGNSQYEQIIDLVRSAASSKSPLVRLADRYSVPFTIIAFGLSGLAWAISGNPINGLAVLVVATPCPLLIATPVAIVSGMSRAAHQGIIIKDGVSLETLARLQVLAFDKTGTLTQNAPTVQTIKPVGISQSHLLQLAASVESGSVHTLAKTIVTKAHAEHIKLLAVTDIHEEVGLGISAHHGNTRILMGRPEYLLQHGVKLTKPEDSSETTVYIAKGQTYIGSISFVDPLRPEAKSTLQRLYHLGIHKTLMLTGDKLAVAKQIANDVHISDVHAELLPKDKLKLITQHHGEGLIIGMVGDGVNDAPVLAAADVGIALGAKGSTAASESADVVIMLNDFGRVATAVSTAQRSLQIAKQSIFVGIGLSVILMIFAAFGKIPPLYGAILQEFVDVAVILNALRARFSEG